MKRKNSLEEFIQEHRAAFDDLKAPAGLWERINKTPAKVHSLWKWIAVAASSLLLITVGYIMGMRGQHHPDIAGWDEYVETEQYYEARISQKMEEIKTLEVSDEVLADIKILDDVYHDLKTQLTEDPNADTHVLLSAMIRHQQQKLEVMEEILNRVDKYKSNDNEGHQM